MLPIPYQPAESALIPNARLALDRDAGSRRWHHRPDRGVRRDDCCTDNPRRHREQLRQRRVARLVQDT